MWLPLPGLKIFGTVWSCGHWKLICPELGMDSLQKIQSCRLFMFGVFFPFFAFFLSAA